MAGSKFGTIFQVTTWGESHGEGVGVVIDGCPAGLTLSEKDVQAFLDRRKPGSSPFSTARKESDTVKILSGLYEERTTGTPISMTVKNSDQHSGDYEEIASLYRPGHADYTYDAKYGFRDPRGGGRSSGRETVGRVAAGAVASKLLSEVGIKLRAYAKSVGPVSVDEKDYDFEAVSLNPLLMPSLPAYEKAAEYVNGCRERGDSCGGVIECVIYGLPAGIGEPVFEKLDANLAKAVLSVGAVKGFEIGSGFSSAVSLGSANNDPFISDGKGGVKKASNNAGGTLGGISDGSPVVFRAAVKPTPSVSCPQQTVTSGGEPAHISIKGRHDPLIVPRAVVVIESMAALVTADLLLLNMSSTLDKIKKIYGE